MYYLDNASTTRPHPEVVERVYECLTNSFGNPSSVYSLGVHAAQQIQEARRILAEIFRVPQAGILFCAGGSESNNLAIKGVAGLARKKGGNLVTSNLEHACVANTIKHLEEQGFERRVVPVNPQTGQIELKELEQAVDEKTILVSIHHVNNETGVKQDLAKIGRQIKNKNPKSIYHVDGVQAFGKIPILLKQTGVDLYSVSAHKIHGVKGVGALIQTKKTLLEPLIHGGGQEFGYRSGTENVAGISAFGLAAQIAQKNLESNLKMVTEFSAWFCKEISQRVPQVQLLQIEDPAQHRIPHIVSLSIRGVLGEVLLKSFSRT